MNWATEGATETSVLSQHCPYLMNCVFMNSELTSPSLSFLICKAKELDNRCLTRTSVEPQSASGDGRVLGTRVPDFQLCDSLFL